MKSGVKTLFIASSSMDFRVMTFWELTPSHLLLGVYIGRNNFAKRGAVRFHIQIKSHLSLERSFSYVLSFRKRGEGGELPEKHKQRGPYKDHLQQSFLKKLRMDFPKCF